jgi:hypothetical protein
VAIAWVPQESALHVKKKGPELGRPGRRADAAYRAPVLPFYRRTRECRITLAVVNTEKSPRIERQAAPLSYQQAAPLSYQGRLSLSMSLQSPTAFQTSSPAHTESTVRSPKTPSYLSRIWSASSLQCERSAAKMNTPNTSLSPTLTQQSRYTGRWAPCYPLQVPSSLKYSSKTYSAKNPPSSHLVIL